MEEQFMMCPDCGLRRYLKDHKKVLDPKAAARHWIQVHCLHGHKKRCSTRLVGGPGGFRKQFMYGKQKKRA